MSGCATTQLFMNEPSKDINEDMARIHFKREYAGMGDPGPLFILDSGSNLKYNVTYVDFSDNKGPKPGYGGIGKRVTLDYCRHHIPELSRFKNNLIVGHWDKDLEPWQILYEGKNKSSMRYHDVFLGYLVVKDRKVEKKFRRKRLYRIYEYSTFENGIVKKYVTVRPNAKLIGEIGAGDSLVFDRPSGKMKIKVITHTTGIISHAPPIQVEAGKEYFVEYNYRTDEFTVH